MHWLERFGLVWLGPVRFGFVRTGHSTVCRLKVTNSVLSDLRGSANFPSKAKLDGIEPSQRSIEKSDVVYSWGPPTCLGHSDMGEEIIFAERKRGLLV